tara:strand:- start:3692 stop:4006 length:315 start_codon:yes stop_codon:yes gene_type:complete
MKTKELLNEWRNFLSEGNLEEPKYKKGDKVNIEICCDSCAKHVKSKQGKTFSGEVVAPNLPNRKIDFSKGSKQVNFVLIKVKSGEEKSFPECCVDLGMKNNESA